MKRLLHISVLLALALTASVPALAQTTYTASASGDWGTATTWTPNGIPGALDNVIINDNFTVTVNTADRAANTVTINAPSRNNRTAQLVVNAGRTLAVGTGGVTMIGSPVGTRLTTLNVSGTLTVNGNLTVDNYSSVTFNLTSGTLNITGAFTKGASGIFTSTGSTVNFNGTAAQTLDVTNIIFNNVSSNNTSASGLTPNAAISATNVTGNISIQSGIFDNAGFDIVGGGGATFSVSNGATFRLSGASSAFPTGYGTVTLGATSTVNYAGTAAQAIAAQNYGNLISSSTGARTLASTGTIGIAGTFNPGANAYTNTGSTINFNGTAAQTIPVFSYNNLTSSSTGSRTLASGTVSIAGTFTPGTNSYTITGSTVNFNGTASQTIPAFNFNNLTSSSTGARVLASSGTIGVAAAFTPGINSYTTTGSTITYNGAAQSIATFTYNNLTLAGSSTKTLPGALTIGGSFTLSGSASTTAAGALSIGGNVLLGSGTSFDASTFTHTVAGNWTSNGGTFAPSTGTISFNGISPQTIGGSAGSHTFNGVTVNNGSGLSISTNVTVGGILTFTSGNISTGANTLISTGTVSRTSGHIIGSFRKSYTASGSKTFEVGTVSSYTPAVFTINGLSVSGTLTVGATSGDHPSIGASGLDNTKSVNVYWTASDSGMSFTSHDVTFTYSAGDNDVGTTASNYDLGKHAASSWLTYQPTGIPTTTSFTATGILSADGFGDYQIAEPVPGATYHWDGGGDGTSWGDNANWFPDGAPGSSDNVILDNIYVAGSYTVTLGANRSINGFTLLSSNASLQIGTGTALTVAGTVDLQNGLLQTQTTFPSAGTVTITGGTVEYNAAGAQSIFSATYANLTLSGSGAKALPGALSIAGNLALAGTASLTASSSLSITGNVTLGTGTTLNGSSVTHTVGGNWTNNGGTFTPSSGTITFNGTAAQAINGTSAGHSFNNLTVNKAAGTLTVGGSAASVSVAGGLTATAGTYALTVPTTVTGTTTLNGGTISVAATTLNLNGATSVTSGSLTSDATGTVSYGGSAQTVISATYGNLTLAGSGTKTLPGSLTIGGTLTLSGTASTTAAGALTVSGSVILGSGTSFDASTFSHSVAGDWTNNGGTFTPSSSTLTFNGSSAQAINGTATGETFNSLTVNNAAGLTLSSDVTTGGALTFTIGNINATSDTLTTNGTVTATGGHVVGYMKKPVVAGNQSLTFEVGDAGAYTPVTIDITGSSGAGTLTASTTGSDHPQVATSGVNPAQSANRYWTILGTGFSVTSADVTVNFVAGDLDGGADPTTFVIDQYNGSSWLLPTTGTVTSTSTQATGLTSFGDFQVGQSSAGIITSTATGGNWSATTTWVGGVVPANNADVLIATTGSDSVTIDVTTATLTSLTINSGSKLSGASGTNLTLKGSPGGADLVNDGTFNGNGGTVLLTASQEWSGTGTFNLSFIDLNNKTLTLSFAAANTISVDGATTPIITPGTLTPNTNTTVAFTGSANQTINVSGLTYHHLTVNNSAVATLDAAVTSTNVGGNLRVLSGTLNNGGFAIDGNGGATLEVADGATFELDGTSAFPTTFTPVLGTASVVDYLGSSHTIKALDYGTLELTTGGIRTFETGTTRIAGNFVVSGTTVDATTNTTTIVFNGSGAQAIDGIGFYVVQLANGGVKTLSGTAATAQGFTIPLGVQFDMAASSVFNVTAGNMLNAGTCNNAGTLTVTGSLDNDGILTNAGTITVQ